MRIENDHLIIRSAVSDDAEILCGWWNDGSIMAHAGFYDGIHTTPKAVCEKIRSESDENSKQRLILEADHHRIGEMVYFIQGDHAEIGIKICESSYQNKGIGTTACSLLIQALFEKGISVIEVSTDQQNLRARHVYEKLGFRLVRIDENCYKDSLGNLRTAYYYILEKSWFMNRL